MVSSLSLGHRKFPLKLRRNTNVERRWWLENIFHTFQEVQTLLVAVCNHQLPQSCLLLDLEAEEREEYTSCSTNVMESVLPNDVSSLVLDLQREALLSSPILRLRQGAGLILVVRLHGFTWLRGFVTS